MKVVAVKFSDGGDDMTFIDGVCDSDIINDAHLIERLAGDPTGLESYRLVWIESEAEEHAEDWWFLENLKTVDELNTFLLKKPHLLYPSDYDILVKMMSGEGA